MACGLCVCAGLGSGSGESESGKSGSGSAAKAVEQCGKAEAYLKEQGYTVYIYSAYPDSYASKLGVDVGSLVRVINSYNDDGARMLNYYFKTEEQVRACYNKDTANYKLAGLRVVYGDPDGIIK